MYSYIVTVASGFESDAMRELRGIYPDARISQLFLKGLIHLRTWAPPREAVERLKAAETETIGRIHPVDVRVEIPKGPEAIGLVTDAVVTLSKLAPGDLFRVNCDRRGSHEFQGKQLEISVADAVEERTGAKPSLRDYRKVIVIQILQEAAFVGVTDADLIHAKTITRYQKFRPGERPFTRAAFKLEEALRGFGLEVTREMVALDVGAAPGGWTKVLAGLAGRVVAVDPADLHPSIAELPNVTHLKIRSESLPSDAGPFDIVTNDMNVAPRESAAVMLGLAGRLKPGAAAVMTIKFTSDNPEQLLDEAILLLEPEYTGFRVGKVPHNRKETTLLMWRRSPGHVSASPP